MSDDRVRMSRRERSPDESIYAQPNANVNSTRIAFADRTMSIIALLIAALALGAVWMQANKDPQILDSKLQANSAEVRASVQQQVAAAQATANSANQHARVALDKVEDVRAKLAEKGIKIEPLDGH